MMKTTAATTLSSAVVALSLAASSAYAENSAPTPTLHNLATAVSSHESRISSLEKQLSTLKTQSTIGGGIQKASFNSGGSTGNVPRSYIIQTGDTISEIARSHNVQRSALMRANNLDEGQQIYIGDELIIPSATSTTPQSQDPNFAKNEEKQHHVTKPEPAPKAEPAPAPAPTPSAPKAAPTPKAGGTQLVTYKVQKGDSLSKIARNNNISVQELVRLNNLSNANHISINQPLKIPAAGTAAPATQASAKPSATSTAATPLPNTTPDTNSEDFGVYTVQKGDTLWSLARDFFTTQQEIQQLNKMGRSIMLKPGQELVVPTKKYFEYHNRLSQAS